jgi:uncharacterized protein YndB with AHSA1/START domain
MKDFFAKSTMLIRRPIDEVFDAFVQPEMITSFWLESTTAPLAPQAKPTWRFMVPGAIDTVEVTQFEPPRLIAFKWSDGKPVTLSFGSTGPGITEVTVEMTGFDRESGFEEVVNATEGFTIVLCDLKTLLESGRSANLVRDKAKLIAGAG